MRKFKTLFLIGALGSFTALTGGLILYFYLSSQLPELFSVADYEPLLVSEVYARNGEKIGEFYRENRTLTPIEKVPEKMIQAFLAAEDGRFFEHHGFNYQGILRAVIANFITGERTQGASTITQQTARTLFLSSEKTYTRKLKEAILSRRMENHLTKNEILYLYLNQIYFGQGAHGVASAAETFFRKKVTELSIPEIAVLAGSLTAPSAFNVVNNPKKAKIRQRYVLDRMLELEFITEDQFDVSLQETLTVYRRKKYKQVAPYFVETIRQLLVKELGEEQVLDKGLKIYSSLDFEAQKKAQESVRQGLRELDKRQGYRGVKKTLDFKNKETLTKYLTKIRNELLDRNTETFTVLADGSTTQYEEFQHFAEKNTKGVTVNNIPPYIKKDEILEAVVTKVDDKNNLVYISFAEAQGIIPLENMAWARPVDLNKKYSDYLNIKKVSAALSPGDIVDIRVVAKTAKALKVKKRKKLSIKWNNYAELSLEQEPAAEAALISFDQKTEDIVAMVGGSNFRKTKLNRTYQAQRQTGSSFKPIVYAAGLDKGLTPATPIMGAPIVKNYSMTTEEEKPPKEGEEPEEKAKVWKPGNYGGRFTGDILLRNALKKSLNAPTIRVLEKTGVSSVAEYAKRLGIFSPLNMDMSLGLGSSGVSLYEMTKVFSILGRMGKNIKPIIIHEIQSHSGEQIAQSISFDLRFQEKLNRLKEEFTKKREEYEAKMLSTDEETQKVSPFFFNDPDQLISPQTAFLITTILQAAVNEPGGTGGRARKLGRDVSAKTGTTNGYYDAWFMGYTPQISTGVWVGFDQEKSLGRGETGGRAALPIWLGYMMGIHDENTPKESFPIPNNIVFANIDNETGKLATARSHEVVRQAFVSGTEPGGQDGEDSEENTNKEIDDAKSDFYREDF